MGTPSAEWYIDALMAHENLPYYVGLLTAAAIHGASHQAIQEFQVITNRLLPRIVAGRTRMVFSYRKDMAAVAMGIEDRKVPSGYVKLSTPELTVLDLLRYPRRGAGFDNIATVLCEIGERLNSRKLARLSSAFERAVGQRLGHLLERFGNKKLADALYPRLSARGMQWTELNPRQAGDPDLSPPTGA
ncbi:MAG: type IV toxin-antitoxin system AbiEi family antitoxin [Alphaproteobacteria bacterium]|nr:type IV toxin-antitoxin system AbiEi family antitoxin [Alphaproteobacteria bacterium]